MITRVVVLGHRGMLGARVAAYFGKRCEVLTTHLRFPDPAYLAWVNLMEPDAVVNCAIAGADPLVNVELPRDLHRAGHYVIHPSTDCLTEDTPYAETKRLAERFGALVLRTSIVDPAGGLLGWLRGQREVTGYTDHLWNGITTLSWAEVAWRNLGYHGIIEPVSPAVTKAELLRQAADVYGWPVTITERPSGKPLDRRLPGTVTLDPIRDQMERMA